MLAWMQTTVREGYFLEDMQGLLSAAGWEHVAEWTKIAYFFTLETPPEPDVKVKYVLAKHMIMKNAAGEMVGFVLATDEYSKEYGLCDPKPSPSNIEPFKEWIIEEIEDELRASRVYMYMLEDIPSFDDEVICEWDGDLLQMALDAEVASTERRSYPEEENEKIVILESEPLVMQSPIVIMRLRCDNLESTIYANSNKDEDNRVFVTNWWPDSLIKLQGWLDDEKMFLAVRADTGAAWKDNALPYVPLFFGKFDPEKPDDVGNTALFAGSAEERTNPQFDYDKITESDRTPTIFPILKQYPENPSNGVDSVMVHRGAYGARYQEYFLSLHSSPHKMIPPREYDGRKYPRAFNRVESPVFSYKHNPSNYSNEVLSSKIQLVHPDEGVRGSLPFAIGLNPLSLRRGTKLKIPQTLCPNPVYDWYYYFLFEGLSPFTKRPSVAYRPAGVGIYMKTGETADMDTAVTNGTGGSGGTDNN